jgi:hypothetical protein
MSAPTPKQPASAKRPFVVPLAAGLVLLTVVREGLPRLWPGVSTWVFFVAALALGYAAYVATERLLIRREQQKHPDRQP